LLEGQPLTSRITTSAAIPTSHTPTRPVSWTFILAYALGYTGTWLALLTPVLITIAMRVRQLAPDHAPRTLAMVLAVGAAFALVGNPIFGHLSDRTHSRWGMRRPWLLGGMLCGALALLLIAHAQSVAVVMLGWCLAQLAFNAVLAAMVAVLPDQVPIAQRGLVSGVLAVCLPIGQACGTLLIRSVADSIWLSFMLPALIGTAAVLLFAWVLPDRRMVHGEVRALSLRETLATFWVDPRAYPDFTWAWLSRILLVVGSAFLTTYLPFYLLENLRFTVSDIPALVSQTIVLQATVVVAFSLLCGRMSDVFGRRKIFVMAGGVAYAVGFWLIAIATSHEAFLIGIAVTGAGHGAYFGTDLALATEILRDRQQNSGSDLGILNITNALPQVIAPPLGALVLSWSGGSYGWLYVFAGIFALCGAAALLPLRSVR
jgi:MFS family permease